MNMSIIRFHSTANANIIQSGVRTINPSSYKTGEALNHILSIFLSILGDFKVTHRTLLRDSTKCSSS